MNWRALLQRADEEITFPWVGERTLVLADGQSFFVRQRPQEHGWHKFRLDGRDAFAVEPTYPETVGCDENRGYLVGDLFIFDDPTKGRSWCPQCRRYLQGGEPFAGRACGTCHERTVAAERVHLTPELERFSRVVVGRTWSEGALICVMPDFPLGPEDEVRAAFEDHKESVQDIRGVTPGLAAAFHLETTQRRVIEERQRALEAQRQLEARRAEIARTLGSAAGRRELAHTDFRTAASAALRVGGAEYLDHRLAGGQYIVRYRIGQRRFECVCDGQLRVIDAGVCLTAEYDHDVWEAGTKGDTWFTLESLPGVIQQAEREDVLVVFRRV